MVSGEGEGGGGKGENEGKEKGEERKKSRIDVASKCLLVILFHSYVCRMLSEGPGRRSLKTYFLYDYHGARSVSILISLI